MGGISIDSFVRAADVVREWDRLQAERASRRFFALHVAGVEVTQGIQYYRASAHLTDPADRQPDNAMMLVSGKPGWVRVYVRSGFGSGDIGGVRGTLEVARRRFGGQYVTLTKLSPLSPRLVTAHHNPAYAAERSDLSSSVNFVVPGSDMCGYLQLTATITAPGEAVDTYVLYVDATLEQTLRLRGVMVAYNGPSSTSPGASTLTLPAPTVQDRQSTSAWTLAAFPVQSSAGYSSGGTITLSVPLSDAALCPGCCTQNWLQLNQQVWAQVVADGNQQDVLYYGLLPKGVPTGQIVGCAVELTDHGWLLVVGIVRGRWAGTSLMVGIIDR